MSFEKYNAIKAAGQEEEKRTQFYEGLGHPIGVGTATSALGLKEKWCLKEVFTIVYIMVDDAYKKLFGHQKWFRMSPNNEPKFTDAEVITLALVAQLSGYESQHAWWQHVRKNHRDLFPDLCDRTRYGRRLQKLTRAMEQIRQHILFLMNVDLTKLRVVDSFPVSVCHLRRANNSSQPFEYKASFGYCAAKKEFFYGFKVHLITDLQGIPLGYLVTPGHVHDTTGLAFLLQDMSKLDQVLAQLIAILGDKGYVGKSYAQQLKDLFGVELLAMAREYDSLEVVAYNQFIGQARKIIETSISVLTGTLNANHTKARSLNGFLTNLVAKITAFNLANYLNMLLADPVLHISSFVN